MSMFDSIKNIFSKGEVGVGRSNPLDSMPIANGTNRYATPEKMTEIESNHRPEQEIADWVNECPTHKIEVLYSDENGIQLLVNFNNEKEENNDK